MGEAAIINLSSCDDDDRDSGGDGAGQGGGDRADEGGGGPITDEYTWPSSGQVGLGARPNKARGRKTRPRPGPARPSGLVFKPKPGPTMKKRAGPRASSRAPSLKCKRASPSLAHGQDRVWVGSGFFGPSRVRPAGPGISWPGIPMRMG